MKNKRYRILHWLPMWLKHIIYYERRLKCVDVMEGFRYRRLGWRMAREEAENTDNPGIMLYRYELKHKYRRQQEDEK